MTGSGSFSERHGFQGCEAEITMLPPGYHAMTKIRNCPPRLSKVVVTMGHIAGDTGNDGHLILA
jgi:hypothetical protein